jgi:ferrochelatase
MGKTAIVLLNLGGPDSKNAVRPFLMNFFMDKNIIRAPIPLRCLIAWSIAKKRSKDEAKASYDEIGGFSPLLPNTNKQAEALQTEMSARDKSNEYKVFVCMRYWHPMSDQVVREVKDWGADEIVLLPLYPQYSTTTTRSSIQVWQKACHFADYECPTRLICCYPWEDGYIKASAENISKVYKEAEAKGQKPRVLFSAHGLPESVIKEGDPYQWQCEQTAEKIVEELGIKDLDWQVCYQSRVGPKKWIGPSTEEAIEKAVEDKVPVLIYPHAFTQEHVETLVELDIEYKEVAEKHNILGYYRAETVGTHPLYIKGLADMVLKSKDHKQIAPDTGENLCPSGSDQCCMREYKDIASAYVAK